ncbi:hypothetical protein BH23ACT3_BH23ACT3_13810 [soil metagenome]
MTASAPDRDVPPLAHPPCRPLVGVRHGGTEVFPGGPYATAERFARPSALDPCEHPLDATRPTRPVDVTSETVDHPDCELRDRRSEGPG